jgi:hypothetical protein
MSDEVSSQLWFPHDRWQQLWPNPTAGVRSSQFRLLRPGNEFFPCERKQRNYFQLPVCTPWARKLGSTSHGLIGVNCHLPKPWNASLRVLRLLYEDRQILTRTLCRNC